MTAGAIEIRSLAAWAAEAEAAAGIARSLAGTAFIPDSLRVRDDRNVVDFDATIAQVTAALLTGQELGFSPMASLRSIDVIPPGSGSPALRAAALRGILLARGHDVWVVESTETRAVVRGRRAGTDITQESIWTIDRAKRMAPRGYSDGRSAWQRMPQNQLLARATAEVARWVAADALLGLPYIAEEVEDDAAEGGAEGVAEPAAIDPPAAPPRPRKTRRKAGTPAALPAPPSRPSTAGRASDDGTAGDGAPAAPRISPGQRARLWAGMRRLGYTADDRDAALGALAGWVGRDLPSTNALTEAEATTALDKIAAEEVRREARAAAEEAQAAAEATQGDPGEPEPDPRDDEPDEAQRIAEVFDDARDELDRAAPDD